MAIRPTISSTNPGFLRHHGPDVIGQFFVLGYPEVECIKMSFGVKNLMSDHHLMLRDLVAFLCHLSNFKARYQPTINHKSF